MNAPLGPTGSPAQVQKSDELKPQSVWLWWEAYFERMFILFCIYTLSIGPMYWQYLNARHASGPTLLAAFYEPLRLLGEYFPLFGKSLNWYISLWVN
ncbi:hypothetical protein SH668x_000480 [Planctomicrobium sp. SH668]|uniref:hypothetical protein n=1 Tax=Planctomicrobium sp. SH668 TaxID=3448126 RepID=UPI003F5C7422